MVPRTLGKKRKPHARIKGSPLERPIQPWQDTAEFLEAGRPTRDSKKLRTAAARMLRLAGQLELEASFQKFTHANPKKAIGLPRTVAQVLYFKLDASRAVVLSAAKKLEAELDNQSGTLMGDHLRECYRAFLKSVICGESELSADELNRLPVGLALARFGSGTLRAAFRLYASQIGFKLPASSWHKALESQAERLRAKIKDWGNAL
jgi:hypothetical protein